MKSICKLLVIFSTAQLLLSCVGFRKNQEVKLANGYLVKESGQMKLPPYKEKTLPNGLKIVFVKDESLPRVSLTLLVKGGTVQEDKKKAGLNAMTALLLEQGTQTRTANAIADEFGALGTSLSISPDHDFTTMYSDALFSGVDRLVDVFADVIMNPSFKDSEISRMRSQLLADVRKKIDNPSTFASSKIDEFLFGEHPYGRDIYGTSDSLRGIGKQEIIRHYLTYYRPNNSSLAVVGQFNEDFEKKIEDVFSQWAQRKIPTAAIAPIPGIEGRQVRLVVKKDLQQAQIRISTLGVPRSNPNYLKLRLANESLGGGFASRLNQKVRAELGLTYSIGSNFYGMKDLGSFDISTFTKNETAGKTFEETLQVLTEFAKNGASENELMASQNQLIGQFPRAIETSDRLAYNILVLDFFGIPVDYLINYNKTVEEISVREAHEAFAKVVDAKNIKVVVYGNESIIPQFEKFNPEIVYLKK